MGYNSQYLTDTLEDSNLANLQRVGVLAHPSRSNTGLLAEGIADTLRQRGLDVWIRTAWDADKTRPLVENSDMVVAIGGDGAMLHTARVCAPYNVPIFGLNTGYLGFLTEANPEHWDESLARLLDGDYWVEERMMINGEIWQGGVCTCIDDALNDVVISRGAVARSVHLETFINDTWTTTYNADGLIIATPTGSTAYALATGGPILPPDLRNILISPVAPHLSMDRALVLSEDSVVKIVVAPRSSPPEVVVTVDGESIATIGVDDSVVIRASQKTSRFIRLRERGYFFRSLLDRLEPKLVSRSQRDAKHQ
ncbi:MAG: NAD(+)/NADH kinase [Chloroflexi bacterium]|nr:NAD(+)/NADH kinase [Chloroflexota bacterium]